MVLIVLQLLNLSNRLPCKTKGLLGLFDAKDNKKPNDQVEQARR